MIRLKTIAAVLLSSAVMAVLTGCPHRHHDNYPPPPDHHDQDHDHDGH